MQLRSRWPSVSRRPPRVRASAVPWRTATTRTPAPTTRAALPAAACTRTAARRRATTATHAQPPTRARMASARERRSTATTATSARPIRATRRPGAPTSTTPQRATTATSAPSRTFAAEASASARYPGTATTGTPAPTTRATRLRAAFPRRTIRMCAATTICAHPRITASQASAPARPSIATTAFRARPTPAEPPSDAFTRNSKW